mmetsp:Transcript_74635/g.120509  ORF Transcript_74635/g.120509 Transcript_74635/m.120509 type:complete len:232 (-) Transcript_74635:449-1144(-)
MQFYHRSVQLLGVEHGRRAALEIRHIAVLIANQEGPLKLATVLVVDSEVGRDLHGALCARRDVAERAVAEDRTVQGSKVVVAGWDYAAHVLLDHFGMLLDSLTDGAKDHPSLQEFLLEGSPDALAIEDGVNGHVGQALLLCQTDAKLLECLKNFGIHLVQALLLRPVLWSRVVHDVLEVDCVHLYVGPVWNIHALPLPECVEAELQHPIWLLFKRPNFPYDVLIDSLRQCF